MKLLTAILILAIALIAGCTQTTSPTSITTQYVCPNGSTVNNPSLCNEAVNNTKNETANVLISYTPNEDILRQTEKAVFEIVNEKRTEFGIKKLIWNDVIANLARAKSKDMTDRDYFDHKSPEGVTFGNILDKNRIFYIVEAEDISLFGNITSEQDLLNSSRSVVEGWINSPGHRVPLLDRDEIYSDTGVGVYCNKNNTCYFTMEFIGIESKGNTTLPVNYVVFYYIYDPSLPFDYNVSVLIEVNSTKPIDTYIVDDKSSFNTFWQTHSVYAVNKFIHNNYVNTTIIARKGYGIIFYSDPDWVFSDADIKIKIRYLNSL
jgi:uncharacterized protein YkwD